ncbi:MAG: hypothetical protein K8I02_09625, partial [Candidatus Methylomirabilis sp.]|nr:hypothetical protein [Deltaproteobacteria bacterium]
MTAPLHKKVLIANRGVIARRILRTLKRMRIPSVAVFSNPDADAPFVREADERVPLHGDFSRDTYLNVDKVIEAAKKVGATAIHPGYGFLSEKAAFARRCKDEGSVFIGPSPEAIEAMGDKASAREAMRK